MSVYQPGDRLATDCTQSPEILWLAYGGDDGLYAACYVGGALLQHGGDGWFRHDAKGRKVRVPKGVIDRALSCEPTVLPRWPGQVPSTEVDGWPVPVPLTREATLPPFPVDVFCPWMADFALSVALATQTPVDMAAMFLLGALATAAGGRVGVEVRRGWTEPLNLYLATAMDSGNRKTVVVNTVSSPIAVYEKELADLTRPEIARDAARRAVAEAAAAAAAKAAATARSTNAANAGALLTTAQDLAVKADEAAVRSSPRLLADDCTPEALASLMAEPVGDGKVRGRIAVISDEGGIFDLMAGRYNNGRANLDAVLKAWSGSPIRVDRKGRGAEYIPDPALTMALAVQPDVLRSLAVQPGFRGRGLLARYLYYLPPSPLGYRLSDPPPVPAAVKASYEKEMLVVIRTLDGWETKQLGLTDDAAKAVVAFEEDFEPRLRPTGDLAPVTDWGAKLTGQLVRIGSLLHVASHLRSPDSPVGAESIVPALELADYFVPHALAVFDLMGRDQRVEDARYVIDWLVAHDKTSFTARDLYTANRYRFPTADSLDPVLSHLESFGWIRPKAAPERTGGTGRPPGGGWLVNPYATRQQKQQNSG